MANERILIIDDDDDQVLTMQLPLKAAGYQVSSAPNGTTGLQMVKGIHPDLIILDAMMDTPTEGFQLALTLRNPTPTSEYSAYRTIPILMVTAIHSTTRLRFSPDSSYLPVDSFIDKPIAPNRLLDRVYEFLQKRA